MANIKLWRTAALVLAACLLVPLPLTTAAAAGDGKIMVQWFGQSAFKINSVTGKVIMVDPFLTKKPKTPPEHKDLAALGKVDLVLVFHAHGDHVGDGPELAKLHQAPLYRRETGSSSSVPASSTAGIGNGVWTGSLPRPMALKAASGRYRLRVVDVVGGDAHSEERPVRRSVGTEGTHCRKGMGVRGL